MDGLQTSAVALAKYAVTLPEGIHPRLDPTWLEGFVEAAGMEKRRLIRQSDDWSPFAPASAVPRNPKTPLDYGRPLFVEVGS
jgi:hypothetical protein